MRSRLTMRGPKSTVASASRGKALIATARMATVALALVLATACATRYEGVLLPICGIASGRFAGRHARGDDASAERSAGRPVQWRTRRQHVVRRHRRIRPAEPGNRLGPVACARRGGPEPRLRARQPEGDRPCLRSRRAGPSDAQARASARLRSRLQHPLRGRRVPICATRSRHERARLRRSCFRGRRAGGSSITFTIVRARISRGPISPTFCAMSREVRA